jgi:tetratricopeptide (TPR) repeat protein
MMEATLKAESMRWPRLAILLTILVALCIAAAVMRQRSRGPEWEWYDRAAHAAAQGDRELAVQDLQRAVELNRRFAPAYDLLAACHLAAGRYGAALAALDRFAALAADQGYASVRIAETYAPINNRYLLRRAREAVLQGPRSPRAHMLLALGLARSGAGREALVHAGLAEQMAPSPEVAEVLKQAAPLVSKPVRLSLTLQQMVSRLPYEPTSEPAPR